MTQCSSQNGRRTWRCPRESAPGKTRCAECLAQAVDAKRQVRERAAADRAAFFAKHGGGRAVPTIVAAESDRAPKLEMGRRYGVTTVLHGIDVRHVRALCHLCSSEYDCERRRVHLGTAARHGCGCQGGDSRVRPAGPLPREHAMRGRS